MVYDKIYDAREIYGNVIKGGATSAEESVVDESDSQAMDLTATSDVAGQTVNKFNLSKWIVIIVGVVLLFHLGRVE